MPRPQRATIAFLRAVAATTILATVLFGLAQGVGATPAPLADGSEIVVTDRNGDHLLGYGRVESGVLRLSFAEHDDEGLAVMVIDPEGRLSTLVGRFAAGALQVRLPGAVQDVTLASWLAERGVRLTLDPARSGDDGDDGDDDRDGDDDESDDDDRADAPAGGPSDDGDDGAADDDRDDDAGDDEDDADDADDANEPEATSDGGAGDDGSDDDAADDADDGDGDGDGDGDRVGDDAGDEDDDVDADDD